MSSNFRRRITEASIRRHSEHHEDSLSSLEELSLHQQRLIRIELVNRVCKRLKILLLQDNCIRRLENLHGLRELEELNLAMNCIERIENLQCCPNLRKLDLTLNFIGALSTINALTTNEELRELYLMGNPCASFKHYRTFVIANLPQLKSLDGQNITKTEKLMAKQQLPLILDELMQQEQSYLFKRVEEKEMASIEIEKARLKYENEDLELEERRKLFFESCSKNLPEYREEEARMMDLFEVEEAKIKDNYRNSPTATNKERKLYKADGVTALNINEAGLKFELDEDSDDQHIFLNINLTKQVRSDELQLEVEPSHIRLRLRSKIFQLRLNEIIDKNEVEAKRSLATGKLNLILKREEPRRTLRSHQDILDLKQERCVDVMPDLEDI